MGQFYPYKSTPHLSKLNLNLLSHQCETWAIIQTIGILLSESEVSLHYVGKWNMTYLWVQLVSHAPVTHIILMAHAEKGRRHGTTFRHGGQHLGSKWCCVHLLCEAGNQACSIQPWLQDRTTSRGWHHNFQANGKQFWLTNNSVSLKVLSHKAPHNKLIKEKAKIVGFLI